MVRPGLAEAVLGARASGGRLTGIWIDEERAIVARWHGQATVRRIASEVPSHHRSTGHIRHDPSVRHGGGGPAEDQIERDRAGHLRAFLDAVAEAVPPDDNVEIIGPGTVREHLARLLVGEDRHRGRTRTVTTMPAGPMTEAQFIARVRSDAGDPPRRRGIEPGL